MVAVEDRGCDGAALDANRNQLVTPVVISVFGNRSSSA